MGKHPAMTGGTAHLIPGLRVGRGCRAARNAAASVALDAAAKIAFLSAFNTREILRVIRARLAGDAQIGAEEGGSEFRNQLLHRIGLVAEALAELSVAATLGAGPVAKLMTERGKVGFRRSSSIRSLDVRSGVCPQGASRLNVKGMLDRRFVASRSASMSAPISR
jgi:hypothetical protein